MEKAGGCQDSQAEGNKLDKIRLSFSALINSMQKNSKKNLIH